MIPDIKQVDVLSAVMQYLFNQILRAMMKRSPKLSRTPDGDAQKVVGTTKTWEGTT